VCDHLCALQIVTTGAGFGGVQLPSGCDGRMADAEGQDQECKSTRFVILTDQSVFINQQPLKLQESPEVGVRQRRRLSPRPCASAQWTLTAKARSGR
jgi:DNA replicative helicase MCM subunit Mcm2 (Cdc46/Mcm family)